jgi:hypothetical protein
VFSPVLVWNASHGWASFAFQGDRAMGVRFRPLMPLQTLGGEALFVLPWLWVPMMFLLVRGFRRDAAWPHRLLVYLAAPPIIGFAVISAWSSQRILFHWAAPGYLMLFPLAGDAIARRLDRAWVRALLAGTTALVVVAITIIATDIQFDWLGSTFATALRKDPTDEGVDWISLQSDLRARGLLPPNAVVAALNWRDAGKIGYGLDPDATMLCLNSDARQFGFAHPVADYAGQDMLLLLVDPNVHALDEAKTWFRTVDVLAPTSVRLNGRVLRTVAVLWGRGLRL